ncbi:unnamed protein product, partial [marine sediment metagenome]
MNKPEMQKFLEQLFNTVFAAGDPEQLINFYSPDLVGHHDDNVFGFEDIKNRINYMNKRYHNRKYHINEFVMLDDKFVVVWTQQTGIDSNKTM